jgi:hypothetical protein
MRESGDDSAERVVRALAADPVAQLNLTRELATKAAASADAAVYLRRLREALEAAGVSPRTSGLVDGIDAGDVRDPGAAATVLRHYLHERTEPAALDPAIRLVARALPSVAAELLLDAFAERTSERDHDARVQMAYAAEPYITPAHEATLLRLYQDKIYGDSRIAISSLLSRIDTPASRNALMAALDDAVLAGSAAAALGDLRASEARERLEALRQTSPDAATRSQAKRAIGKIDTWLNRTKRR